MDRVSGAVTRIAGAGAARPGRDRAAVAGDPRVLQDPLSAPALITPGVLGEERALPAVREGLASRDDNVVVTAARGSPPGPGPPGRAVPARTGARSGTDSRRRSRAGLGARPSGACGSRPPPRPGAARGCRPPH